GDYLRRQEPPCCRSEACLWRFYCDTHSYRYRRTMKENEVRESILVFAALVLSACAKSDLKTSTPTHDNSHESPKNIIRIEPPADLNGYWVEEGSVNDPNVLFIKAVYNSLDEQMEFSESGLDLSGIGYASFANVHEDDLPIEKNPDRQVIESLVER